MTWSGSDTEYGIMAKVRAIVRWCKSEASRRTVVCRAVQFTERRFVVACFTAVRLSGAALKNCGHQ